MAQLALTIERPAQTGDLDPELAYRMSSLLHDPPVAVKLIYQLFAKLPSRTVLHARSDTATRSRSSFCAINLPCCSCDGPPSMKIAGGREGNRDAVSQVPSRL